MAKSNKIVVEHLDTKIHNRKDFDCGNESLNSYIAQLSGQYEKRDISRTYVSIVPPNTNVIGYYSISSSSIDYEQVTLEQFPRHPTGIPLPCALIGRLAVDNKYQGQGLGEHLLLHALNKINDSSKNLGISAVIVQAIDKKAKQFYEKYGFLKLEKADDEFQLVLGMKAIRKIFS